MSDLSYYAQLRDTGITPLEIYSLAKQREAKNFSYIRMSRYLFNMSLREARQFIREAEEHYFTHHVVQKYRHLLRLGVSMNEMYKRMRQDAELTKIDHYRILIILFGISLKEAQMVIEGEEM